MSLLQILRIIALAVACYVTRCSCYQLADSYNNKLRPNVGGPPVEVRVGLYIESLGAIKESTMDFRLTMYFREKWNDPRLAFNKTYERIYGADAGNIFWTPDLFFLYEKSGHRHDLTVPNIVTTIQPDGTVFRSSRISLTSACYMDLQRFPFDRQRCSLNIMSYSLSTKHMKLVTNDDDVETEEKLIIPSFVLKSIRTTNEDLVYSTAGNFSLVKVIFTFQRQMQSFLLTVYIPSILLVTVAWLSFCIDAQAAPARVSLGITTVLTITTMTSGIQESLPVVTYAKAIDVWLAACLIFVFTALIEYALANYLLILNKKRKEAIEAAEASRKSSTTSRDSPPIKHGLSDEQLSRYRTQYAVPPKGQSTTNGSDEETQTAQIVVTPWTADRVDCLARHIYPAAFTLFNLIYWPVCIWMTPDYTDQ
ncbi:glycine receptor subunit alpha-3-like isoform X1 [Strongylocentrotus purpuratus]|uniref:Uncharacterized protein n=1 Tax=Strongylocentrotus purpuratus TaxID=7668 RepID=A0A7M7MYM1_STRPU|nr:glycine receptor subunit alpha-3-like isoform X1 [Strongylocentrotus purpuratus]